MKREDKNTRTRRLKSKEEATLKKVVKSIAKTLTNKRN